ncbi:diacylglycerol kinase [Candidatus Photodesmus blepharus]|uniref:diacylglycerol kinase n=1 Tax=Candidatus Photodesmus blepharonis TaxID=1179155 RepID=UPI000553F7A8|nr:diacylglycerol kinase [Candidatus Photodesmus blepharus]
MFHGLKRLKNSARYSCQGLKVAFRKEASFRQEVWLGLFLIPLSFWLDVTQIERILLVVGVLMIMLAELLNTAIEVLVDLISPRYNELAAKAKDIASASVMVTMITAGYIWLEILWL